MSVTSGISRRKFLSMALAALPGVSIAHALTVETEQLEIHRIVLNGAAAHFRFIHFSDIHFTGDSLLTRKVTEIFRHQQPDFACFSGDLIESDEYKDGAFEFIKSLGCPVYGAPGNHDRSCGVPYSEYEEVFKATGGEWLVNRNVITPCGRIEIVGIESTISFTLPLRSKAAHSILIAHKPLAVDGVGENRFMMVLAGHSHGGQIRLPFLGPLVLPEGVGGYVRGQFETNAGLLNVSAGLGTSKLPIRFNCPPEITIVNPV